MAKEKPTDEKIIPLVQPTPEEVKKAGGEKPVESKAIDSFTSRFIPRPPGEQPLVTPKKKEDKPAVKPKAKPAPAHAAASPPPVPLGADEIAEAAARGVATALAEPKSTFTRETRLADEEIKRVEELRKLPAAEQRRVSILTEMEKSNPDKYKGMADLYKKSLANLVDYAAKWETEHPGETFDEDAEDHKEWIAQNEQGLDWDDDDYTDALAEIKVQKVVGDSQKKDDMKVAAAARLQSAMPVIAAERLAAGRSFLSKMGEEYAAIVGEDGVVKKEVFDKLNSEDPVKTEIIISSADMVERLVAENHALFNGLVPFSGQNPLHRDISNFILQKEAQLLKLPSDQQQNSKGHPFKPAAVFWKLSKEQQGKFWTFNQKDIQVLLVNGVYQQAKKQISVEDEKFAKRAKARGINLETPLEKPTVQSTVKPVPADEDDKPETPDVPIQPRTSSGKAPESTDSQSKFFNKFIAKA